MCRSSRCKNPWSSSSNCMQNMVDESKRRIVSSQTRSDSWKRNSKHEPAHHESSRITFSIWHCNLRSFTNRGKSFHPKVQRSRPSVAKKTELWRAAVAGQHSRRQAGLDSVHIWPRLVMISISTIGCDFESRESDIEMWIPRFVLKKWEATSISKTNRFYSCNNVKSIWSENFDKLNFGAYLDRPFLYTFIHAFIRLIDRFECSTWYEWKWRIL